ncbi:MAG: radical SAM family heme chaperone HemW [Syntrophorhabdaceae bacterium]
MNKTDLPGLYIHVPFCKTKCPYCDFYSITDSSLMNTWIAALLEEAASYREFASPFDSLYIGGGTPSILDEHEIDRLIGGIRGIFRFDDATEVTIEVNPDDVTDEKLRFYRSAGINRISLGVQSFREEEVRFLKRRHTAWQALHAADAARHAGFTELGIDLIYGLPGQSMDDWRISLDKALSLEPDHLSCYQLTIEGDTAFSRLLRQGKLTMPEEAVEADFFIETSRYLSEAGYIHYEISNFAKGSKQLARHNVKYWQHTPYLGLGPSAHSFAGGKRWWNTSSVNEDLNLISSGTLPTENSEMLSVADIDLERLLFGFRTMWGINLGEMPPETINKVMRLHAKGFIEVLGNRAIPTRKGYLFADKLPLLI